MNHLSFIQKRRHTERIIGKEWRSKEITCLYHVLCEFCVLYTSRYYKGQLSSDYHQYKDPQVTNMCLKTDVTLSQGNWGWSKFPDRMSTIERFTFSLRIRSFLILPIPTVTLSLRTKL